MRLVLELVKEQELKSLEAYFGLETEDLINYGLSLALWCARERQRGALIASVTTTQGGACEILIPPEQRARWVLPLKKAA